MIHLLAPAACSHGYLATGPGVDGWGTLGWRMSISRWGWFGSAKDLGVSQGFSMSGCPGNTESSQGSLSLGMPTPQLCQYKAACLGDRQSVPKMSLAGPSPICSQSP